MFEKLWLKRLKPIIDNLAQAFDKDKTKSWIFKSYGNKAGEYYQPPIISFEISEVQNTTVCCFCDDIAVIKI